jgi:hypothetical protein
MQPCKGGQQRGVNVHHLVGVMGYKKRAQDAHEAGQNKQLGLDWFKLLYQGLFKSAARMGVLMKVSMVYHCGWQALLLSPLKALSQGVVGKHKADLGLKAFQPLCLLSPLDDAFHVGSPAGDQDNDIFHER